MSIYNNYMNWNNFITMFTLFMMAVSVPSGAFVYIVLGTMMLLINAINYMTEMENDNALLER